MSSFFKLITSEQWDEAKLTGRVPRTAADESNAFISVYSFKDLESVVNHYFNANDYPVALEFSPNSYAEQLTWQTTENSETWQVGELAIEQLSADLVLNIYSFEHQEKNLEQPFKIQGESW